MNRLEVLYEDNHILVVNKPCNILSQEDCTGDTSILTMVKYYVKEKYNKPNNVCGIMEEESGKFIDYLKKSGDGNSYVTTSALGKKAVLRYSVLDRNFDKQETLVLIELETGRHHQIRVQFASRGYPLCGDQRYGKKDFTQIALCSYKISFLHPVRREKMFFQVAYPKREYFDDFTY